MALKLQLLNPWTIQVSGINFSIASPPEWRFQVQLLANMLQRRMAHNFSQEQVAGVPLLSNSVKWNLYKLKKGMDPRKGHQFNSIQFALDSGANFYSIRIAAPIAIITFHETRLQSAVNHAKFYKRKVSNLRRILQVEFDDVMKASVYIKQFEEVKRLKFQDDILFAATAVYGLLRLMPKRLPVAPKSKIKIPQLPEKLPYPAPFGPAVKKKRVRYIYADEFEWEDVAEEAELNHMKRGGLTRRGYSVGEDGAIGIHNRWAGEEGARRPLLQWAVEVPQPEWAQVINAGEYYTVSLVPRTRTRLDYGEHLSISRGFPGQFAAPVPLGPRTWEHIAQPYPIPSVRASLGLKPAAEGGWEYGWRKWKFPLVDDSTPSPLDAFGQIIPDPQRAIIKYAESDTFIAGLKATHINPDFKHINKAKNLPDKLKQILNNLKR